MKLRIKTAAAGAAALALAATLSLAGGGTAFAASSPFDPGANGATQGTLSLYDAAGNAVTSGSLSTPPAYALADTWTGRTGANLGTLYGATPVEGQNPLTWPNELISVAQPFPSASAPGSLANNPHVLAGNIFIWFDSAGYPADFPNTNANPAWQNLYQLRMIDSGPGLAANPAIFASATIQIDSAAGTWTQIYPQAASTTTTVTASPASPQNLGASVTFTATVAPAAAAGSVQFKDGNGNLGAPVTVSSGTAALTTTALSAGTHAITAVFTSSNPASLSGSTSAPISYRIIGPADNTATAVSANPSTANQGDNVALTATVSDSTTPATIPVGSVKFYDGGVLIPGSQTNVNGSGNAVFTTNGLAVGSHAITATFTPTDATAFNPSTSSGVDVAINAAQCTTPIDPAIGLGNSRPCGVDPQTVDVNVPAGSLVISTPYGPNYPFHLGDMTLSTDGSQFQVSKGFPETGEHLVITDTRSGDLPWTASAASTVFSGSGSTTIDQAGLSFTGVAVQTVASNTLGTAAKPVVPQDIASFTASPQTFATAAQGNGTVWIVGTLGLTAPTSVPAGLYTATVTFTIA